ncbi:MAG: cell wall surface anchor family protein, partial [Elusimicrobia bacterium]
LSGLSANTTYFLMVAAVNHSGLSTSYSALGSTATPALPPASAASTFSAVAQGTLSAAWSANGNPSGTRYDAVVSTEAALDLSHAGNVAVSTAPLGAPSADFAGLAANATYFLFVRAVGHSGAPTAYQALGSTVTLVYAPASVASTFSPVGLAGASAFWSANGNSPGTRYEAVLSTASPLVASHAGNVSVTTEPVGAPEAVFSGLSSDSTYYLFVAAFNRAGSPTAYVGLGSTVTLAAPPATAANSFPAVERSSMTAAWSGNGNGPGTLYELLLSTETPLIGTHAGNVGASSAPVGALFAVLSGLTANTTYFAFARSVSRGGSPTAYVALGSTATLAASPAAGTTFLSVSTGVLSVGWSTRRT